MEASSTTEMEASSVTEETDEDQRMDPTWRRETSATETVTEGTDEDQGMDPTWTSTKKRQLRKTSKVEENETMRKRGRPRKRQGPGQRKDEEKEGEGAPFKIVAYQWRICKIKPTRRCKTTLPRKSHHQKGELCQQ